MKKIGNLNPAARPAQQLMELLWSEQDGEYLRGNIYAFTSRLLKLGYVQVEMGGLTVRLTDKGRGVALAIGESTEGQLYRKEVYPEEEE